MPNRRPRARAGHRSRFKRASANAPKRVPTKHIPPALIIEAKRLYTLTNVPVGEICAMLGLPSSTFYRRVEKWGWAKRLFVMPSIRRKGRR